MPGMWGTPKPSTGGGGGGGDVTLPISADDVVDGLSNKVYPVADKNKLAGIAAQATKNATDAQLRDRSTHTGTQDADTITDGTTNKAYTATEQTKLAGIATGATANDTDANLKNRANHTGTQPADTITETASVKMMTSAERTKLAGVASGATANDTDANLKNRANHTGTQTASTISDLTEAVQDIVGAQVAGTTGNITATYNDTTGTLTLNTGVDLSSKMDNVDLADVALSGDAADLSGGLLPFAQLPAHAVVGIKWTGSAWESDPGSSRTDVVRLFSGGTSASPPTGKAAGDLWVQDAS